MTLSRRWVRGAVWVVLLMVGSVLARAQEVSGNISGTVVDATGASVSGAVVTLTNIDRAFVERTLKTDKAGYYTASSLPLGHYSATITMNGFKATSVTGLVLHANDALRVDEKLEAGSTTETVSVVAARSPINTENSASEGLVTGTQVRELPLVTRNYEQLLPLQPGVSNGESTNDQLYAGASTPAGMSNQVLFSINGERPSENDWTVDGADNVNRGGGAQSPTNPSNLLAGGNQTLMVTPSVDAISEFVTLRGNYEAEYGRNSGAQINVETKSGTNQLHGDAYEFFRNDALDANTYFNKMTAVPANGIPTVQTAPGSGVYYTPAEPATPRPALRYNDFGFTVGGPVIIPHVYNGKDKTFFFYSQEFRRVVQDQTLMSFVPTAAERAGDFSNSYLTDSSGKYTGATGAVAVCAGPNSGACTNYATNLGAITPSVLSPTAQAYVSSIYNNVPLPQSVGDLQAGLDPHVLTSNIRNIYHETQEIARIDEQLNSKANFFYRYINDSVPTIEGAGLFPGANPMPEMGGPAGEGISETFTKSPGIQQIGHMTVAVHPTFVFDLGYAYSLSKVNSSPVGAAASANSPSINPVLPFPSTLGVIPSLTFPVNGPSVSANGLYNARNVNHNGFGDVTKTMKEHTLRFGLTYNHYQAEENSIGTNNQGNFSFNPAAAPSAAQLAALPQVNKVSPVGPSQFDSEFANFLIGNANNGYTQSSLSPTANINENMVELYLQDEWRATRRLTVNMGIRYSFFGQPYDIGDELSNFDPATYSTVNAETISSTGSLCTMAGQTTPSYSYTTTGILVNYTLANCPNVNGLNSYQPNTVADPLNGIILGNPDLISDQDISGSRNYPYTAPSGAPAIQTHGSPWGLEVGHAEKHDWAPRLGFAYDLFGDGKTSLRGGYGMAYDDASVHQYEEEVFNNPPYVQVNSYSSAVLDVVSGALTPNLAPPALYATPTIYKTPYVQQYSLDVQDMVTPTMTVDVGYFGDHGTHLLGVVDINEVQPGAFTQTSIGYSQSGSSCSGFSSYACEAPLNQIRPYRGYTAINSAQTIFNSNYNSLQVKVTKKFSGESMIDANYTYSRSLTNAQNDFNTAAQNSYNLNAEYGPSPYNRNQILTVDGVWELPWMKEQQNLVGRIVGGWELTGVYALSSGLPLTATMQPIGSNPGTANINYAGLTSTYNGAPNGGVPTDAAGLGILPGSGSLATLRPNQVLNPSNGYGKVNLKTRMNWFNQTAFAAPAISTFQVGNEQPGAITGPGYNRLDIGIFRTFKLYRGTSFTLRGEGYNVLNHTNWGSVNTVANSSTFGQVTSTRDPRILQVAGKLNF